MHSISQASINYCMSNFFDYDLCATVALIRAAAFTILQKRIDVERRCRNAHAEQRNARDIVQSAKVSETGVPGNMLCNKYKTIKQIVNELRCI